MNKTAFVNSVVPVGAIPTGVHSSGASVVRATQVEIVPDANTEFSYNGNSRMVLNINSPSAFWDLKNTYLRFNLEGVALTNNGVSCPTRYLATGGAHALIRTVSISTMAGALITRVDNYNRWYARRSQLMHDKDYVNSYLAAAGDGIDNELDDNRHFAPYKDLSCTLASVAFDGTSVLTLGAAGKAREEIDVGDIIYVEAPNAATVSFRVIATPVTDTAVSVADAGAAIVAGPVTKVTIWKVGTGDLALPTRAYCAQNNCQLTMKLDVPFLSEAQEWLPLFLLRSGIRIELDLERPEFVLCAAEPAVGTGFAGAAYTIKNPTLVCPMIEASQQIMAEYLDLYKSQGLNYAFMNVRGYSDQVTAGSASTSIQIQPGVRSARYILGAIQDSRAQTVTSATVDAGKNTYCCDSIAQGRSQGLSTLQYSCGSEHYPLQRPIDCSNFSKAELLEQAVKVFGEHPFRHFSDEWQSRVNEFRNRFEYGSYSDSKRLVLCTSFERDDSPYAGLDCQLIPIQANMVFDSAMQLLNTDGSSAANDDKRTILHWVAYDSVFSLSPAGAIVYS